jgi:hypothetical protein
MVDHDDLPGRLHRLGTAPLDPARTSADLTAMARVGASPRRRPSFLRSGPRVAAAFLAGLLLGSTGLAAADVLPDPAQHVAHTVLARVGVDVPNPERYHGPECGPEVKRNHGAYVRDDHALAQTDCGKPVGAGGDEGDEADEGDGGAPGKGQADKGPCHGKPPWAGNKTMTPEEVAAAKAERAAQCGTDDDDAQDEVDEADEGAGVPGGEGEEDATTTTVADATTTTSTTEAPTTTTEATTTTTG